MNLSFQAFVKKGTYPGYGKEQKLTIDETGVHRKPITSGRFKTEKRMVNQSLLQTMKKEGFDEDTIRYCIGFNTRENDRARKLKKFEEGDIRLTDRMMKIIAERSEICIAKNKQENEKFIETIDWKSFFHDSMLEWDMDSNRIQAMTNRLTKRLQRMGMDGKHRLVTSDLKKSFTQDAEQLKVFNQWDNKVNKEFVIEMCSWLDVDPSLVQDSLDGLVGTIKAKISDSFFNEGLLDDTEAARITQSSITDFLEKKKSDSLTYWIAQTTKENLVSFSLQQVNSKYSLKGLDLSDLIREIKNQMQEVVEKKGFLDKTAVEKMYKEQIQNFLDTHETTFQSKRGDYWKIERQQLEGYFLYNLETLFGNIHEKFLTKNSELHQPQTIYNAIQQFIFEEPPDSRLFIQPVATLQQLVAVVPLAMQCLISVNPDAIPGSRQIGNDELKKQVNEIHSLCKAHNMDPNRTYDIPHLDPNHMIRQAVAMAESMAKALSVAWNIDSQNFVSRLSNMVSEKN